MASALAGPRAGCGLPRGRLPGELQLRACLPAALGSSQGHIQARSQIPALLEGRFSHLVAVFRKSLTIHLPALPCTTLHREPRRRAQQMASGNWSITRQTQEKLCFFSCQASKTSVARGCAGQMGFPFGSKGEITVQSGDFLQGIPCRELATNPAANGTAAARSLLFPLVIHTIWVAGFEGIKKNLPSYNLAFYFFMPCTVQ